MDTTDLEIEMKSICGLSDLDKWPQPSTDKKWSDQNANDRLKWFQDNLDKIIEHYERPCLPESDRELLNNDPFNGKLAQYKQLRLEALGMDRALPHKQAPYHKKWNRRFINSVMVWIISQPQSFPSNMDDCQALSRCWATLCEIATSGVGDTWVFCNQGRSAPDCLWDERSWLQPLRLALARFFAAENGANAYWYKMEQNLLEYWKEALEEYKKRPWEEKRPHGR